MDWTSSFRCTMRYRVKSWLPPTNSRSICSGRSVVTTYSIRPLFVSARLVRRRPSPAGTLPARAETGRSPPAAEHASARVGLPAMQVRPTYPVVVAAELQMDLGVGPAGHDRARECIQIDGHLVANHLTLREALEDTVATDPSTYRQRPRTKPIGHSFPRAVVRLRPGVVAMGADADRRLEYLGIQAAHNLVLLRIAVEERLLCDTLPNTARRSLRFVLCSPESALFFLRSSTAAQDRRLAPPGRASRSLASTRRFGVLLRNCRLSSL
jgi:hypothetical protein